MHMEWSHFENLLWKLMKMKMVFIVVDTKMWQYDQHLASRKNLLDGARLEIRLASNTRPVGFEVVGMAINLTLQLTRRR